MSKKKQSKNSPSAKDKRAAAAAVTENSKSKKQQHNTEQLANGVRNNAEEASTTTANGDGKTQQIAGKSSKQQQQQLPQLQAPKGLPNLGNTCFYNSTLQCLLNTHPLAHYFAQIQQRTSIVVNKPYIAKVGDKSVHIPQLEAQLDQQHPQMPAFFALRKLFLEYTEAANGRQPNPRQLFEQISRVVPRFRGWNQQDAHELLVYLLDILRTNEIRQIERGLDEQLKHEDTKEAKERRVLLNKALLDGPARPMLDAVFGGQLQQTIRCTRCHQISVSLEPFFVLSLPIRAEAIKSTPTVYHPTTTAKRGFNKNNKKVEEEEKKKKKEELAAAAKQQEELQQPQQNGLHQQNGTTSSKPDKTTDPACPMETPNKALMSKHQLKKHEKADRKKRKLEGKRLNKRRQSNPSYSGQPPAEADEAAQNSQKAMDGPDDEQLSIAAIVEGTSANDAQNEGKNGGKSGTNDDVIDDVDQEMNQALKDYDQEMKAFVKAQLYQAAFGHSAAGDDGMDDPDLLLAMAESQMMAEDAQCGWLPNGAFPANEDIFTVTATAAEEQPSANGGQNEGAQQNEGVQNEGGGQNGGTMNPNAGETMGIFREEIENGKAKMKALRFYGAALGLTFKETMEMDDGLLMAMYHSLQQDNNAAEKSAIPSSNEDTFTVTVTVEELAAASNDAQNEAQNKEESGVKTTRTADEDEAAHCQQKWNSELEQKLKARLKARLLDDADFRCPENDEMDPEEMDPDLFVALAESHAVDTHQMGWNNRNCSTEGSDPEADFAVIEHEDREEARCPPRTTPCAPNSSPTVEEEEEEDMVFEVPTPADNEPCQSPTDEQCQSPTADEAADNANGNGEENARQSVKHNTADGQQKGEEENGESKEEDENEGEDENGEEDESESNCNGHGQQQKFQQQNPLNPSGVRALIPEPKAMDSLQLHLQLDSKQLSVEAALWNFTSTDELSPTTSGYCCGKCAQAAKRKGHKPPEPVTAFKRYLILSPPTILTLHLKRFEQLGGPRTPMKKFSGHVKFGLQLDLGPFCSDRVKHILPGQRHIWYSLYGVVCHSGGLSGGHYIAYVRNRPQVMMEPKVLQRFFQKGKQTPAEEAEKLEKLFRKLALNNEEDADGRKRSAEACNTVEAEEKSALEQAQQQLSSQWFHCSDSYVHKVRTEEEVLNAQAYLLFYERIF